MKRMSIGLVAALTFAACGGGGVSQASPTAARTTPAATPSPTPQTSVVLTAVLRSTEEVPPIANAEASCTGTATVTLDKSANKGKFEAELSGCPADAAPTIMHIHRGAKGANGGVVVNSGLAAGEWKLTAGAGKISKDIATIDAALLNEIITTPAAFYYNIHTAVNGGDVVRAQLEKKS